MYGQSYKKDQSTQDTLIITFEKWREGLDNGEHCGDFFMDLLKSFALPPHKSLLDKLKTYEFSHSSLKLILGF